jgi:hypothetical protein
MHYMLPPAMLPTPRKFPFLDRFTYLKIEQPDWTKKGNLVRFFQNYPRSLTHGKLVLAAVVMANNNLFKPGPNDHAALTVYDLDGQMKPEELIQLAHGIYDLLDREPTTLREEQLKEYLKDDYAYGFGMPVPDTMGPESCRISTCFMPRKHLPGGHLQDNIVPVCADPDTGVAAVFPVKYWSAQ